MKKKIGPKTRKFLISLGFLLVVLGGIYGYSVWQLSHLNDNPIFQDVPGNLISRFKVDDEAVINPVSGNRVHFDLGSRHSFINRKSARRLDSLGYHARFKPTLVFTTDADGVYHLYTQKVVIDVTLPNPELPDSTFVIKNVELLVVDDHHPNVFGMDLLKGLVIERQWDGGIISFYKEVPEGYYPVCNITVHDSPWGNYVGSTGRASIKLAVNDEQPRDYFFDTGGKMRYIELVQPLNDIRNATTNVELDPLTGFQTQRRCRVRFGNRMRFSNVIYCDTLHTDKYSVNPLKLFDQDFAIDMKGKQLLVHKTK